MLRRTAAITVVPGTPGTPGRPESLVCIPKPPPPPVDLPPPPIPPASDSGVQQLVFLMVPQPDGSTIRTPHTGPTPPGYVCSLMTYVEWTPGYGATPYHGIHCFYEG